MRNQADGNAGSCGVRFNRGGELRAPAGYVARRYVRPVEINTIFHVRPGANALTFGMFGCDLRCPYCQNWKLSQALREGLTDQHPIAVSARELIDYAIAQRCEVICAAYNEPLITAEWMCEIFAQAKARGLVTAVISDGNTTPETLEFIRPVTDVYRVDLKGFSSEQYRLLGGRITPVIEGIKIARRMGFWIEIVTLVVPMFNDELGGPRQLARQIAAIDPLIPWHLNAFYPRYQMQDRYPTPPATLLSAAATALAGGLKFVYVGNIWNPALSHTFCPNCRSPVVKRAGYVTKENDLMNGACPRCATPVPGIW
jgi:pyruvate formate lyase activating enzyme